jgi:hypothetical protein
MDIQKVKEVPIEQMAEALGAKFAFQRGKTLWYYSPFRDEKRPSFKIDTERNAFKDFGHHLKGGSIIDLYLDFHGIDRRDKSGFKQAIDFISSLSPAELRPYKKDVPKVYSMRFKMTPAKDIWSDTLKNELGYRGLSLQTVKPFLQETKITDTETGKWRMAFAFLNDLDGYEISAPDLRTRHNFKLCIGPKGISTFHADKNIEHPDAYVFESWSDYATGLQMGAVDDRHLHLVLNSTSNVLQGAEWLAARKPNMTYLFMDNDRAGEVATAQLGEIMAEAGINFGTMNHHYDGHKDLNAYWQKNLNSIGQAVKKSPWIKPKIQPK